ncbi:MAG: DUF6089 family protein [Chloroflexota bacterium]|nr:DUF6089 family protein [Lentimicrobium sp.]
MDVKPLSIINFSASALMKAVIFSALSFISLNLSAQSYGEVGVFGGVAYYIGDLNPGKQFEIVKPAFGGFLRHNFNERLAINLSGTYGHIAGDDAISGYRTDRNLNFKSPVTDISATFEINFFEYFIGSLRHFLTPYMFAGAGTVIFNPQGKYNGDFYDLQPLGTEGQNSEIYPDRDPYKRVAFQVPFGIGVKYSLNDFIGITANWTMHKTYTDYIDDVSKTYYLDLANSSSSDTGTEGLLSDPTLSHNKDMQRGDSQNNDWYSTAGVSISIRINYSSHKKCLNTFL